MDISQFCDHQLWFSLHWQVVWVEISLCRYKPLMPLNILHSELAVTKIMCMFCTFPSFHLWFFLFYIDWIIYVCIFSILKATTCNVLLFRWYSLRNSRYVHLNMSGSVRKSIKVQGLKPFSDMISCHCGLKSYLYVSFVTLFVLILLLLLLLLQMMWRQMSPILGTLTKSFHPRGNLVHKIHYFHET